MPEIYPSRHIISVLKKHGFEFVSQKGSHKKYKKDSHTVIVPDPRKEIPAGTFYSIVRQSGLNKDDFKNS